MPIFTAESAARWLAGEKHFRRTETRQALERHVPAWLRVPAPCITREAIESIARPPNKSHAGRIARALLVLLGALRENAPRLHCTYAAERGSRANVIPWPPAFVVRWSAHDPIARIYDDARHAHQYRPGSKPDLSSLLIKAPATAGADLVRFMRGVEPAFPILRATGVLLEQLIREDKARGQRRQY